MEKILEKLAASHKIFRKTSLLFRRDLVTEISNRITENESQFTKIIVSESRKPVTLAKLEAQRAAQTFKLAADAIISLQESTLNLASASGASKTASLRLVPRGPIIAITPFNFPLNLAAHKIAPALACGAAIFLKPPPQAPSAAFLLKEIFDASVGDNKELRDAFQVALLEPSVMTPFLNDPRYEILSFTGSAAVGWKLKQLAYKKKVLLELGGTAPVIVCPDANLSLAAKRIAFGAFAYAGQICISVQKIFVHQRVEKEFKEILLDEISKIMVGDPEDPTTLVGPLIDEKARRRIEAAVREAIAAGARILTPHTMTSSNSRLMPPTLLEKTPHSVSLWNEEIFGPVAVMETYENEKSLISELNQSRFGIQGGLFTQDSEVIKLFQANWEMPAILINEIPTVRYDQLPYGGIKDSGLGREGPLYAIHEYCEPQLLIQ